MAEFGRPSAASSTVSSSTNKDSIGTFSGILRSNRSPRRVQSEEFGELIGNGQLRHDTDSFIDEENDSTGASSARSQPANPTQPKVAQLNRAGSQIVNTNKSIDSSEL